MSSKKEYSFEELSKQCDDIFRMHYPIRYQASKLDLIDKLIKTDGPAILITMNDFSVTWDSEFKDGDIGNAIIACQKAFREAVKNIKNKNEAD